MSIKDSQQQPMHWHPVHSVKEKKQNKAILIGFIITATLIVGLLGYAVLYETILKNNIPVAKVNGVAIKNDYFMDRVRLERNSYIQQLQILNAQRQLAGDDPSAIEYFQNAMGQIQVLLDNKETFGKQVLDRMIEDEIISQKAKEMGISVSEKEVENAFQDLFAFYPKGTPTPIPTLAPYATPPVTQDQLDILKREGFEQINEQPAENPQSPTLVSPTQNANSPTPTPYTESLYKDNYKKYIDSIASFGVKENNLRTYLYHYLLNLKVKDEIVKDIKREQEQVWARHILVKTLPEALIVIDRFKKGEDWSALASELSLDTSNKDNGGDLGWFPKGRMVQEFEDAAFSLETGKISAPVETQFGFHVIQVIGHQVFALPESDFNNLKEDTFNKWFADLKSQADIQINDVFKDITPLEPAIPVTLRVS